MGLQVKPRHPTDLGSNTLAVFPAHPLEQASAHRLSPNLEKTFKRMVRRRRAYHAAKAGKFLGCCDGLRRGGVSQVFVIHEIL
jgi:hypothetical protein